LIKDKLSPKMEDYLETISFIEEKREVARVGEIANDLGVKSSSVNVMLKILSGRGLLKHEKYGYIKLTKAGQEIAEQVSSETFAQFKKFLSFLEKDKDHQHINIHHRIEEFSNKV